MFSYLQFPRRVMNTYRSLKACHVTKSILTDSLKTYLLYSVTFALQTLRAVLRFPTLLSRWQCRLKRHRFFLQLIEIMLSNFPIYLKVKIYSTITGFLSRWEQARTLKCTSLLTQQYFIISRCSIVSFISQNKTLQ